MNSYENIIKLITSDETLQLKNNGYLTCKYIYPCEVPMLSTRLLGEGGITKVDDYLLKHNHEFLIKQSEFRSLIDNKCLNPYKPYELIHYFVKTETLDKLNVIFKFKHHPQLKCNVIHIGEKGSGKTAIQNYWLHHNNELLEENNIFWVRCDGHKLYNLWLDNEPRFDAETLNYNDDSTNIDKLVDIEQYIDIQLLYVFSKYVLSADRSLFKSIFNLLKEESPFFDMPVSANTHETKKINLYQRILDLNTIINKEESSQKDTWSYAYDHVMHISLKSKQIEKNKWISTSKALQNYFHKHGIWILCVIDGLDNVHINNTRSLKFYTHMLRLAYKFIREQPDENYIKYITLRERTYFEVLNHTPVIERSDKESCKRFEVLHEAANIQDVLNKRYIFASNRFFSNQDLYGKILSSIITKLQPFNLNNIHHNNIRSFLYNKASLVSLVYYRIKQLGHEGTETINTQVENLSRRNEFLNGRLFLNTRKQWNDLNLERGLCCMNLFYFNLDEYQCNSENNWYGLCKTRILQLLIKYDNLSEKDIETFLSNAFNYPINLIINNVKDLRAFGLVDTKLVDDNYTLVISKKGRYELYLSYTDIDTIYYFALDTPLPVKMINKGFFTAHNNKFKGRTHYPISSIVTSISFIIFLINQNSIEHLKYNKYLETLVSIPKPNIVHEISLPFQDKNTSDKLYSDLTSRIENITFDGDENQLTNYISNIRLALNTATPK